jgi:hypothetical protein
MDHVNLRHRVEALEHHVRRSELRARWWRGIACTVLMLSLLGWALTVSAAKDSTPVKGRGLEQRVDALESKLAHVTSGPDDVTITGANLRIVNGLGRTDTTNGVGNLIVGYNEERKEGTNCFPEPPILLCEEVIRTGSHNIVVGVAHNFSRFGGLVIGLGNEISGAFASVSGGQFNTASGFSASVSGGDFNRAIGAFASVSGGDFNTASAPSASVSGGKTNTASSSFASVSGGFGNTASSEPYASVSGGQENTASGAFSSVSGGFQRTAPGENNWAAGPLFADF